MKKVSLIIAILGCTALFGHDAWSLKNGDKLEIVYGHGDKIESYDAKKIAVLDAYVKNKPTKLTATPADGNKSMALLPKNSSLVVMKFDNGFWTKTVDGSKNISKKEAKGEIVSSIHSVKYHKNILSWSDKLLKPIGLPLEITPVKNPLGLKAGDLLELVVTKEKKPLAEAKVEAGGYHDENKSITTDTNGKVTVKIEKSGFNIIAVSFKTKLDGNPDADTLSESANLVFVVK